MRPRCCMSGAIGQGIDVKRILLQLTADRLPGSFDAVTAYDAGVDCVLQYGGVAPEDVRDLVHGVLFRGRESPKDAAVFVGGSDILAADAILQAVRASFFGDVRVSVMVDVNGCNTTAAAIVTKVLSVDDVAGRRVVVVAGTGPVGQRTAALLARQGARVTLTSRRLARAQTACASVHARCGVRVEPAEARDMDGISAVLEGTHTVVCAGTAGVRLLSEAVWAGHPALRVLADVNAVPPLGIEGIEAAWDGEERNGKVIFGALGIGQLKLRVHRACVSRLFERNDLVLDAEEICAMARGLA